MIPYFLLFLYEQIAPGFAPLTGQLWAMGASCRHLSEGCSCPRSSQFRLSYLPLPVLPLFEALRWRTRWVTRNSSLEDGKRQTTESYQFFLPLPLHQMNLLRCYLRRKDLRNGA